MWTVTSWASSTYWRPADTTRSSISCMPRRRASRRQREGAFQRGRQRGLAGLALRGDQEEQRAHGPRLQQALLNPRDFGLASLTVSGPMGRADMAYFGFTNKLLRGETIKIFNMGDCKRDFTYVRRHRRGRHARDGEPARGQARRRTACPWPRRASTTSATPTPRTCSTSWIPSGVSRGGGRASRRFQLRGAPGACSHAAGRRSGDLRGHLEAGARHRLQAEHAPGGRPANFSPSGTGEYYGL